ncbi:MAG: Gfo/Idh/MocA family oxidoreductase [Candidatus Bathyarchaeota archaeon]|nr:Gfo/Idh/MocA family oxidoreductase [Candidatus Bathyarchaeum sp.]
MKQVNLGLIGLGEQGKVSLRNSLRLEGAKTVAVADLSQKARRYAKGMGIKDVYANYDDLLKNDAVDAVVVSLPNFLHRDGAEKAAEAGKAILLEKPLARTVDEGKEILSAVRKNGVKLMMGYDMRFNPILSNLYDGIKDGLFGSIKLAEVTNVSGGPFSPRSDHVGPVKVPSWWLDKELSGGGVLLDLGSHLIDLLSWYFGEVVHVECFLEHMFNLELEDAATCVLKFKDGPVATAKVGWFSTDFLQSVQVCGTAQNMLVQISPQSTSKIFWNGIARKFGLNKKDSNYLELEHFVSSLQKDEQPQPSGDAGLYGLKVIDSAYKNAMKNSGLHT